MSHKEFWRMVLTLAVAAFILQLYTQHLGNRNGDTTNVNLQPTNHWADGDQQPAAGENALATAPAPAQDAYAH